MRPGVARPRNGLYPHQIERDGRSWRRQVDWRERLLVSGLVTVAVVGTLLVVTIGVGALWLIVVVVGDIARRLGG